MAAALRLMWASRWLTIHWYLRFLYPDLRDRREIPATEPVDEATTHASLLEQVTHRDDTRFTSAPQLVLLALRSYMELMACVAVIYVSHLQLLTQADRSASRVLDAIYFSVLTQLTISFGSPVPHGGLRALAALQGFCGLVLVALIITRMMSSLRPLKYLDEGTARPPSSPPAA